MIRRLVALIRTARWSKRVLTPLKVALEASLCAEGVDLPVDSDVEFGVVSVGRSGQISVVPCVDTEVAPSGERREVPSWVVYVPEELHEPYDESANAYLSSDHASESFGDQESAVRAATQAGVALMHHPHFSKLERISAETEEIRRAHPEMDQHDAALHWLKSRRPKSSD